MTCLTCQIEAKRNAGRECTQQELNHWMLWGCTCEPAIEAIEAEAIGFVSLISR